MCCYMRDNRLKPVYISVGEDFDHRIDDQSITVGDVFGTSVPGSGVRFEFEMESNELNRYVTDVLGPTDLMTLNPSLDELRALEIKLTVLPDNSTVGLSESAWGSELVVRPITSAYATLRIWDQVLRSGNGTRIRDIVEPIASKVQSWENLAEMASRMEEIVRVLRSAIVSCQSFQRPFLIQPIWKTEGKSPYLADRCFDVFVWSDLALWKLFADSASRPARHRITRTQRECARTVRSLYDLTTRNRVNYEEVYRGMGLGNQTDKACAFSGKATRQYMNHERLNKPALDRSLLSSIILGGGEGMLSPERRFDASVYFAWRARIERERASG